MKRAIFILILLAISSRAYADMGYVNPYYRSDGTFVSGHWKDTSADGQSWNNRKSLWGY